MKKIKKTNLLKVPIYALQQIYKLSKKPLLQSWHILKGLWNVLKRLILFLAWGLGSIVAFYAILPNLSLSPSVSLIPQNPFLTPFICTNNSILPFYDIEYFCYVDTFSFDNPTENKFAMGIQTILFSPRNNLIKLINPRKSSFIPISYVTESMGKRFSSTIATKSAAIIIIIKYKYFLPPFAFQEYYRFKTLKDAQNTFYWFPESIDEQFKKIFNEKFKKKQLTHFNIY